MPTTTKLLLNASAALALLFSGIWLTDASLLMRLPLPAPDLSMRIASLSVYLALFLLLARLVRAPRKEAESDPPAGLRAHRLLGRAIVVGVALFSLGCLLMRFLPFAEMDRTTALASSAIALLLTKSCGAPLSVSLVLIFARLNEDEAARAAACGMFGAFILEAAISHLHTLFAPAGTTAFGWGFFLIIGSALLTILSRRQLLAMEAQTDWKGWLARQGRRGMRAVFTPRFLIATVVASTMFGFLRGSTEVGNAYTSPLAAPALALCAALIWKQASWGIQEILRGGIVLAGGGIMLAPLLDSLLPGASSTIAGMGAAFFEVSIWLFAVRGARACRNAESGASLGRLITVIGHFIGSAAAAGSLHLLAAGITPHAIMLLILFAYLTIVLTFFGNPNDPLSLFSHVLSFDNAKPRPGAETPPLAYASADRAAGAPPSQEPTDGEAKERAPEAPSPEGAPPETDLERIYWSRPCELATERYGLTPRESDILEQLARGRTLNAICERFVLSPNTVKMHIKHIYQKLEVHSKQEVIDIVEGLRS